MYRNFAHTLLLFVAIASGCEAGSLFGDFTIFDGEPAPSGGQITLTLQGNGTIAARLVSNVGAITGFGFDSTGLNFPESHFTHPVGNAFGWQGTLYGAYGSGFSSPSICGSGETGECDDFNASGTIQTWIIGFPGQFSSVFDVLGGGHASHPFFFFSDSDDQYAADASAVVTPEPSSLLLLGTALLGLAVRRRRSRI